MDCDRVFFVLTRGPFPSGDSEDALVQSHLDGCADCWRLAEALRPAEHLDQESIPAAESHGLPGYWGDPTDHAPSGSRIAQRSQRVGAEATLAPAVRTAARRAPVPERFDRTAQRKDVLLVVSILAAVLLLPLTVWLFG